MGRTILFFILIFKLLATHADEISLRKAVGQMMIVGFHGTEVNDQSMIVKAIKDYHIGGVMLFDHYEKKRNEKPQTRNIQSPEQLKLLTQKLQEYAKKYSVYPLFIAVNQEGGQINTLKSEKGFDLDGNDSQEQLGRRHDSKVIFNQALYRGRMLMKYGVNLNFAPVADLDINKKNPGIGLLERSYGRDPKRVTQDLISSIKAYEKTGVVCTLKHFPGLGSATANTDFDMADVSNTWHEEELIPYKKLFAKHIFCPIIMVSHLINRRLEPSGLPASFSSKIEAHLLREQLNYDGLIITDDMDAKAIREHFTPEEAIKLAVRAGNNIILYGGTLGHDPDEEPYVLFNTLLELTKTDKDIRKHVINSYSKIMALKKRIPSSEHS